MKSEQIDLIQYFGDLAINGANRWGCMESIIDMLPAFPELFRQYGKQDEQFIREAFSDIIQGNWKSFQGNFLEQSNILLETYSHLKTLLMHLSELTDNCSDFESVLEKVESWISAFSGMKDWYLWVEENVDYSVKGCQL